METNLSRNEKILALMTFGAILGFAALFVQISYRSNRPVSQIDTRSQINYQMARPEEGYSEYSLNGREIDQTYERLTSKEVHKNGKTPVVNSKAVKPKTEAEKKAEVDKKKQEIAQKAIQQTRSQQQAKRNALNAEQAKNNRSESKKEGSSSEQQENTNYQVNQAQPNSVQNPTAAEDPNAEKSKKKTFAQWREQIYSKPTRESIDAFLAAYRKGEVTNTEVQAMAQDLLDQNGDSMRGLGLYTLRATPSLASLSQLVHVESQMGAIYKSYIEQAYLAYLQPQNVGYLNQALQTKDKTLIAKTLNILNTNLPKVASGNNSAFVDPRNGREAGAGSNITMSSFQSLLPALQILMTSQDPDYNGLAQQVMSYIQSSSSVAQI